MASVNISTAKKSCTRSERRRVLCRSLLCRLCPPNGKGQILKLVDCLWHFPISHREVSSPPYLQIEQQLMSGSLIILKKNEVTFCFTFCRAGWIWSLQTLFSSCLLAHPLHHVSPVYASSFSSLPFHTLTQESRSHFYLLVQGTI